MISIFIELSETFIDSGLGEALIQKAKPTESDFNSVFIYNFLTATVLYGTLFFAAPAIANFFNELILVPIIRIVGISLFFTALSIVQATTLRKKLDFKTNAKISFISVIISGTLGLIAALLGFGVWALVIQALASNFSKMLLLWLAVKWKPAFVFDYRSFKELFGFSSKLLVSWILNKVSDNIFQIIIGKKYSKQDLGFYVQGKKMQELPVLSINSIFQTVTYPLLSEIQNDHQKLKSGYVKVLKTILYFNFPLMIFLIVTAEPLFILLLTDKWAESIIYFQLFCMVGLIYPLSTVNLNITKVVNRTDIYLRLVLVKRFLILASLLATFTSGITAMVVGQIVAAFLSMLIEMYYSGRLVNFGPLEQLQNMIPIIIMATASGTLGYIAGYANLSNIMLLSMQALIIMGSYMLFSWLLKIDTFFEFINILRNRGHN